MASVLNDTERCLSNAALAFGHGTRSARDEAAWLVSSGLHITFDMLSSSLSRALSAAEVARVRRLVEARINQRIPLAYLLREAWLGEHKFYVDQRVIVPRSFIAELLHVRLSPWVRQAAHVRSVLDLCTGSGCLAILAALSFPNAAVDAADIDPAALAVARRNIDDYALSERVTPIRSNLFEALEGKHYDVILSNPPYVDSRAMRKLPLEYRHEPMRALAGGVDGLKLTNKILAQARAYLNSQGLLIIETGPPSRRARTGTAAALYLVGH